MPTQWDIYFADAFSLFLVVDLRERVLKNYWTDLR